MTSTIKEIECIGDKCFWWITHFYWKCKKLKEPICRCGTKFCKLDGMLTNKVNKQLEKEYPIIYEEENK